MTELNDYSGPFNPRLVFDDFSKEFLLNLIHVWQWAWIQLDAAYFDEIKKRSDDKTAFDCDLEMWLKCAERCNTRYVKIARIPMKNVVDCLKALQLPLDNSMGAIYPVVYDIKNENHAILTVQRCPSLEWCERNAPERIVPMCQINEPQIIEKYKVNPDVRVTARKLPPRKGPDDIACQWELKLEVPKGTRIRSKQEVVNETTDIPELDDLSGPFYPKLTHRNFSKAFLLKMMQAWQFAWITMSAGYYDAARRRLGFKAANDINRAAWRRVAQRVNPRYAKIANIKLNTVLDSLKCLQLPLDNNVGPLYPVDFDIKNENHVIMTMTQCRSLLYYEREAPEMIEEICHGFEKEGIENYLMNPRIKVTPLKLPPRQSPEDIACRFELKIG